MKKKIMVVDDSQNIRMLITNALTKEGYEVFPFENGFEVIKEIEAIAPDLLLADIMMPKLDGLKMLMALKNRKETKDVPVIFLTAKSDVKSVAEGINLGAKAYLTKPIELDQLISKLDAIFKNSG